MLLSDLVINDDSIKPEDPMYTRKSIGGSELLLKTLLSDLLLSQDADLREYILKILFRVHQVVPSLFDILRPSLYAHRAKLLA